MEYDGECDEFVPDEGFYSKYGRDTLPDKVRDAIESAMLSYWRYLDYEADSYHGIEDPGVQRGLQTHRAEERNLPRH